MDIHNADPSEAREQSGALPDGSEHGLSRRVALRCLGGGLASLALAAAGKSAGAALAAPPHFPAVGGTLRQLGPGKAEFRFPGDATVRPGLHEFRDLDDLLGYLAGAFPSLTEGSGLRGTIKRVGKYRRVDHRGRPAVTFGDPILDLITDERGRLVLGGRAIDVREAHATALPNAAAGVQGTLWFPNSSARPRMRFRAFKKDYVIYWKIGADIETWGRDFTTASIRSQYGAAGPGLGGFCAVVKVDSDSDTNDDYVDEYEWGAGLGISSDVAGVRSECKALWRGRRYSGVVGTGCSRGWV